MIDCGGFTELSRSDDGTYSSDLSTYIEYLIQHLDDGIEIKYWALRDWPITDELLREHGRTERDHQRWTIRDHWRSLELAEKSGLLDRSGVKPIAVLQGEDVAGYLWMLDHLRENGLLTDHVCLGSIKKLDHHQVQDIAEAVRDALPSKYTLHGLGITKRHLQYPGIREHFDTIDTQAWNKQTNQLSTDLEPVKNTWIGYIWAFRKYVEKLQQQTETTSESRQGTGTKLFDFAGGQQSVAGHSDSPLNECVCGTTIDPNAILDYYDDSVNTENTDPLDALDMAECRHCRRRILKLSMQCLDDVPDRFGPT
ncbi:deazapurine DNA modification protein DpdA family protein [Haloarcula sp. H-GB5]